MVQRIIITFLLTVCYLYAPAVGFVGCSISADHFLYPLCHANIFHLLGNILCLWMLRCPLYIPTTFVCAALCSFLPCLSTEPTMGFSGVLFSMAGISWGRTGRFIDMCRKCLPFVLITLLIPNVNALIHLYCLMAGYLIGLTGIKDPLAKLDPYAP